MDYDALDRLMATTSPMFGTTAAGTGTVSYSHDVLDNLTHLSMPATDATPARDQFYCYDTHKRLTSLRTADGCAGTSLVDLTYDARGNLASKGTQAYTFGSNNRLYETPGKELYRYDAQGRRTLQSGGTGYILSQYTLDGQLTHRTDTRTGEGIDYIYLGGSLVAVRKKALSGGAITVEYQHTDALGTPVAVTNASRTVIERSEYEPYGQLLNRAQHDGPGFTGHVQDAMTGLTYMQQRYYDPGIGRFLSVDPVTAYDKPGQNFNRYWYANNNPYKFTDPDGTSVWTKLIKIVLKGGNVAAATAGLVSDAKTVMNPEATVGERVLAGASIASEALPVSVGDVKDVAKGIKIASESKEANQIRHIFGQAKHKMDAVIEKFGNPEKARDAIDSSAQKALSDGKLNLNEDGVNSVTRVNVDGLDVDLVGGKVVNGKFELGSASRRDIEK